MKFDSARRAEPETEKCGFGPSKKKDKKKRRFGGLRCISNANEGKKEKGGEAKKR
jgi:hypothetical protein